MTTPINDGLHLLPGARRATCSQYVPAPDFFRMRTERSRQ
jgi:hypothetical protein